jgi:hypothetical protein
LYTADLLHAYMRHFSTFYAVAGGHKDATPT